MQIVIDIPDKIYGLLKYFEKAMGLADKKEEDDDVKTALIRAVVNGTPLPKGHGRLIDADKLKVELECGIRAGNYEEGYEKYAHINNMDDCVDAIIYADTIIKADKLESEG